MAEASGRRGEILRHATDLFATKGVAATSVRDIADVVGILSGSLYHHFPSKDAIIDAVLADYLSTLRSGYKSVLEREQDARERFRDLIQVSFDVARQYPQATAVYQNDGNHLARQERYAYIAEAGEEVRDTWLEVIIRGAEQGVFRSDVDALVVYRLVRDAVWTSARWFTPTPEYPSSRFAKDCAAIFLDGYESRKIRKTPGARHA